MKKINYVKISILLYLISLFIPIFSGGASGLIGLFGILSGWMGVLENSFIFGIPWFANVLFVTNLLFRKKFLIARLVLSFLSISFALVALNIKRIPMDEGGAYAEVSVGVGFLIWLLSFLILFIGQIMELKKPQNPNSDSEVKS